MISIFTPSWADEANTNAQNLSVKNIISRLDPESFSVTMFFHGEPDPRILSRPNTNLVPWLRRGNTVINLYRILKLHPDIFFYPRSSLLESELLRLKRFTKLSTKIVTHVVHEVKLNHALNERDNYSKIFSEVVRSSAFIAGNSHYVAHSIWKTYGFHAATIHNGIDKRYFYFDEYKLENNKLCILYAGSFQPRKRAEVVVRMAAKYPKHQFIMAGSGEKLDECKKLSIYLGCKNIQFLGHLSQLDMGNIMRKADIFLFPSIAEGHPQVLGQATACGLPVLAMQLYEPDYVKHGKTGFLAKNDDELDRYFQLLVNNPKLRKKFKKNACEHTKHFDWNNITEQWANVFKEVVA